jgi:hypothetical protein
LGEIQKSEPELVGTLYNEYEPPRFTCMGPSYTAVVSNDHTGS